MRAPDRRLIYENGYSFCGKIIPLMSAVALGLGLMGSSCLIKGASGEASHTLPDKQSTTGLTPSISTRALIQPVLLAPIVVSGENLFIAWPDNRTSMPPDPDFDRAHLPAFKNTGHANWDIFFVRSYDHGQTFTEPINLSNSTNGTSIGAEIAGIIGILITLAFMLHFGTIRQVKTLHISYLVMTAELSLVSLLC